MQTSCRTTDSEKRLPSVWTLYKKGNYLIVIEIKEF